MFHPSVSLPVPTKAKVEVVSQQQPKDEAPEQLSSYLEEGDLHLEQTDCLREPKALGIHKVQTPEAINGGSHQGVCEVLYTAGVGKWPLFSLRECVCLSITDHA